jgi:hypothetical protein
MGKNEDTREYFNRLKIAEGFTHGDTEKARAILSGECQNIYVVKGRFMEPSTKHYGIFLLFINEMDKTLDRQAALVGTSSSLFDNSPGQDWKDFFNNIDRDREYSFVEQNKTKKLEDTFQQVINSTNIPGIIKAVDENSITSITKSFIKILQSILEAKEIKCVIDYERSTSMVLYDYFKSQSTSDIAVEPVSSEEEIDLSLSSNKEMDKLSVEAVEEQFDEEIVQARPVVSPVKGTYIEDVAEGTEIWVKINDDSECAIRTAVSLRLVDDGKLQPAPMSVVKRLHMEDYVVLYCRHLSAFDVIFKIAEVTGLKIRLTGEQVNALAPEEEVDKRGISGQMKFFAVLAGALILLAAILLAIL